MLKILVYSQNCQGRGSDHLPIAISSLTKDIDLLFICYQEYAYFSLDLHPTKLQHHLKLLTAHFTDFDLSDYACYGQLTVFYFIRLKFGVKLKEILPLSFGYLDILPNKTSLLFHFQTKEEENLCLVFSHLSAHEGKQKKRFRELLCILQNRPVNETSWIITGDLNSRLSIHLETFEKVNQFKYD